jgi:hypothetical protein
LLSATQPDEVVEVFLGDTLEEAMSHAVTRLGPDLTVRRARKVRKGVQGLVGKDRFEVVAVPGPRAEAQAEAIDGAFAALLAQAEEAEDPSPVRRETPPQVEAAVIAPRRPDVSETVPAPPAEPVAVEPVATPVAFASIALEPVVFAPAHEPVPTASVAVEAVVVPAVLVEPVAVEPVPTGPAPEPVLVEPVVAEAVVEPAVTAAPRKAKPRKAPAPRRTPAPRSAPVTPENGWGRIALRELGLPRSVLSRLPAQEPRTDAQWIAALTRAFAGVLPPAQAPSAETPVVVDGYGIEGVRGILAAAAKGMTPGRIHYAGRSALANPTELALAVRAAVLG